MPNTLVWDNTGERLYEAGVSKTVLYTQAIGGTYPKGVAWNGVSSITDKHLALKHLRYMRMTLNIST